MAGWVKIHRQIQDNAIWMSDEPFDSRSAWIDLILMANHEDKEVYQGGQFFKIKRGQLHRSQIKLAERWHWSKKRVIKYLKELKKVRMIDFETFKGGATQGTTITIVNYDTFQVLGATEGTSVDTSEGASPEQRSTHKQEYKNDKEIKNNNSRFVAPSVEEVREYCRERNNSIDADEFVNFYQANGWVQGKGKPIKDWKACVRTWENNRKQNNIVKNKAQDFPQRTYTDDEYHEMEMRKLRKG